MEETNLEEGRDWKEKTKGRFSDPKHTAEPECKAFDYKS